MTQFGERTMRTMKELLHSYMEDYGHNYVHKLFQYVPSRISRNICSLTFIPEKVKYSDILSTFYSKPLRDFRKPWFKIADRGRISKNDLKLR